jgi:hypothetical protein
MSKTYTAYVTRPGDGYTIYPKNETCSVLANGSLRLDQGDTVIFIAPGQWVDVAVTLNTEEAA